MDYEKKYKEALERARNLHKDAIDMGENLRAKQCEIIFPELKESEDEKIKHEIKIVLANTDLSQFALEYTFADMITWLERQGDYANFRDKAQVGDRITKNEAGVLVNLSQLKRVAKPSEKQGKQKFEMKTAEESLGIDSDTYNKIVDECIFGEQKPEENKGNIGGISPTWSENDKAFLDDILCKLEHDLILNKDEKDWLKSLRPQSKQEWSEEDEVKINRIVACLENLNVADIDILLKDAEWLKSLRPQNHWKPSDEQISLLQAIINEPNNAASESCQIVLKDILEQLKKLKEE